MSNLFVDDNYTPEQPEDLPPRFTDHPLYHQAENLIQQGNWLAARTVLEQLQELYPDDRYLAQLVTSARTRSALLGHGEVITVDAIPADVPRSNNRALILGGLTAILLLCGIVGAGLVWVLWPQDAGQTQAERVEQLREEAQAALESGDYDRAVLAYNQLLRILPDDRQLLKELDRVNQLREVVLLYSEAIAEMEAQHWENALAILQEIEAREPGYRDVPGRITFVQTQQTLTSRFNEAEVAFNQGNYTEAIPLYEALQAEDYGFQRDLIQNRLFLAYLKSGLAEEEAAGQDVKKLKAALERFEKALNLRPEDSEARSETQLLRLYLAGVEEFQDKNWAPAAANLEPVYEAHTDFANGNAAWLLYKAYVNWGDELFTAGQFELAKERYETARRISGIEGREELVQKVALVTDALNPPTPTPEPTPTPVPPPAVGGVGGGGAVAYTPPPTPTPTPVPYPYSLKSMSVRNNCSGQGYIHGVVWNAYNLPLTGVIIHAVNKTTGAGPFISNPTNQDGIYQIIVGGGDIEGLWAVQVMEEGEPVSLVWGQRLGGACQNGAQELKVDWQREIQLQ